MDDILDARSEIVWSMSEFLFMMLSFTGHLCDGFPLLYVLYYTSKVLVTCCAYCTFLSEVNRIVTDNYEVCV